MMTLGSGSSSDPERCKALRERWVVTLGEPGKRDEMLHRGQRWNLTPIVSFSSYSAPPRETAVPTKGVKHDGHDGSTTVTTDCFQGCPSCPSCPVVSVVFQSFCRSVSRRPLRSPRSNPLDDSAPRCRRAAPCPRRRHRRLHLGQLARRTADALQTRLGDDVVV